MMQHIDQMAKNKCIYGVVLFYIYAP